MKVALYKYYVDKLEPLYRSGFKEKSTLLLLYDKIITSSLTIYASKVISLNNSFN